MMTVFDILLLALAVAAVWKLRSVLGRRTGYERSTKPETAKSEAALKDISLPPSSPVQQKIAQKYKFQDGAEEKIDESAKEGLAAIVRADKNFTAESFLRGARAAYAMIIEAFAAGDMDKLKNLAKRNVAMRFQSEIERRADKQHVVSTKLTEISSSRITQASLDQEEAQITVEIHSQQLSWTKDEEGRIIAGDPNTPRAMKDLWTFSRSVSAEGPNWQLIATSAGA